MKNLTPKTILAMALASSVSLSASATSIPGARPVSSLDEVTAGLEYNITQPPIDYADEFTGKRVGIIAAHGVLDIELSYPYEFFANRGAQVEILAPGWSTDGIVAVSYIRPSWHLPVDRSFADGLAQDYDLLIITGGAWNSTVVRKDNDALTLIHKHVNQGRMLAALCSGVQVLIDAGLADQQSLTGTSSIKTDLINAGADYLDQSVVVSGQLITSRSPDDLPDFVEALAKVLR